MIARLNPHVRVETHDTRLDAGNALEIIGGYDIVADGSDNFATRYLVSDACYLAKRTLVFAAVGPFDGYVTTLKPHETGPDGKPFPSYRCIFPEPPPPGTVANCAEVGVLGAAVGVVGTLQATEVLKEIVGFGESLAGRLLLYDARNTRFNEIKIAWDPANPLSGKIADDPRSCPSTPAASKGRCAPPDGAPEGGTRQAMAIRGILFDKDGTVIDYWRTWVPINREVALYAARGNHTVADELLRLGGHDPATDRITPGTPLAAGSVDDIAEAFAAHPQVAPAAQLVAGIERIFRSGGAQHSALIDGVRDTLVELKRRGFRIGLVTNDSAGGLEASLAQHDVLPLFDFTVGCDSGFGSKPDPRMVLGFCEAVGLDRGEVAMVGDAVHDLALGRAARVALERRRAVGHQRPQGLRGPGRPDPRQRQRSAGPGGVRLGCGLGASPIRRPSWPIAVELELLMIARQRSNRERSDDNTAMPAARSSPQAPGTGDAGAGRLRHAWPYLRPGRRLSVEPGAWLHAA